MAESKKISFAFTKSIKKSTLKQVPQEEKKIDYIKCLDAKAIKVIGEEEKKEEPLVIPLLGTNTWHNRVINQTNADIFETKPSDKNADKQNIIIKKEPSEASNEHVTSVNKDSSSIKIKKELPDENEEKTLTLEEQAAQEIMKDLELKKEKSDLTLPLVEDTLRGVEESTLEDYEKIPVDAFGLAMLRGMGWTPGKGLGKNEKVVVPLDPVLRPKILGISKLAFHKTNEKTEQEEKELRLERASYVKIIAGRWANAYGQVEGFDQDTGRVMVKMALNNNIISVNEDLVQLVTKAEYLKNSKVLNATKYEEYKNKEDTKQKSVSSESSNDGDVAAHEKKKKSSKDEKHESKKSRKTSKEHRKDSSVSDYDSDNEKRHRNRRYSSDTDSEKKTKKSKKHKEKDREREKREDRLSKYSESYNRRKSTKYKSSKSRSSSKR